MPISSIASSIKLLNLSQTNILFPQLALIVLPDALMHYPERFELSIVPQVPRDELNESQYIGNFYYLSTSQRMNGTTYRNCLSYSSQCLRLDVGGGVLSEML